MAITGTDRGQAVDAVDGTSFAFSPSGNFAAGSWGVLCLAVDNPEALGAAHTTFTVTDSLGNTWTRRISPLYDPGGPEAGVEGAIFTTPQDGGTLATDTVITVTFGVATNSKGWSLMEVIPTGGSTLSYVTGGVGTGSNTATPTVTTGSITSGNMVIAALFAEAGTSNTTTEDSDTTNGSWSTQQTAEGGGTGAAGMTIASQRKVVTATGTQSYDPGLSVASDCICGWIEITETGGGSILLLVACDMANMADMKGMRG